MTKNITAYALVNKFGVLIKETSKFDKSCFKIYQTKREAQSAILTLADVCYQKVLITPIEEDL